MNSSARRATADGVISPTGYARSGIGARTMADSARSRVGICSDNWKVELFFKWIKQHLRIKHFYGTSDNAVKTQIWISICVYVLVV